MKFDQYEVLCREDGSIYRLGQGATSSSYKALDTNLRTPVVLKVIRPELLEDETARKRFMREARAAALLRHPNVAQIYRMGEEDGSCFYAREFVEGETLDLRVNRDGPLETTAALKVALQVADALVAVKEAHLVNRDIKPSNLMISPRGEVKIIDFGLTKSNPNGQIDGVGLITMNGFVGSSDYASPEQLSEEPLDVTSDMYSLGVSLWFLLTGRRPFRGAQARVMSAHLSEAPPFEELSAFPSCVVSLLAHLLEKDPSRRPSTPLELISEIKSCLASVEQPLNATTTAILPLSIAPAVPVAALPLAKKISPARAPARERSPRQFVLAELVVGTMIAVIVYLVLSRPVNALPPSNVATVANGDPAQIYPPPAAAHAVVQPQTPALSGIDGGSFDPALTSTTTAAATPMWTSGGAPNDTSQKSARPKRAAHPSNVAERH